MRLLNASTFQLFTCEEGKAPPYAILSHTWHTDEVLFHDLQYLSLASKKAGFRKIKFCCEQALEDGYRYVWIDTCCIDKSSSSELSEAINSMYRWYQNARECYAYLRDVAASEGDRSLAELGSSRWFKRAWTLQELLAPESVTFYTSDWKFIGFRSDLTATISKATGIDEEYLCQRDSSMASVAKRMSWAANREATRAEDIAYSLFGLFDVQMPLLYGEGLKKAFMRLQEEIMKFSDDHTLFAWGMQSPEPPRLPDAIHDRNSTYESAEDEIWTVVSRSKQFL